jgi:hypothetical protein
MTIGANLTSGAHIGPQFWNDLARDAVRGDALAGIVHRIKLSPIRLRVILSAAALSRPTLEMLDRKEAMLIRDVPLRIKRRGAEMSSSSKDRPAVQQTAIRPC